MKWSQYLCTGRLLLALGGFLSPACGSVTNAPIPLMSGFASEAGVPSPDYQVALSELNLTVDAQNTLVQPATGRIILSAQEHPGFELAILERDPGMFHDEIHAAFLGAAPSWVVFTPLVLYGSVLRLPVGTQLPTSRYVILSSFPEVGTNVRSYQVLSFYFPGN